MIGYLRGIWKCRYFWLMLVRNDLRQRYRRSMLGVGWSLLQPIAMTCIICFVFSTLLNPGGDVTAYAAHVLAGLACWSFILTTTLQGCQCFHISESYIRQYPAPLAIYPLRIALAGSFHFLIATVLVIVLCLAIRGVGTAALLPILPVSLLVLFIVAWSLAVLAGLANVYFQDTQHLAEVGFQILFYMTPIIYDDNLLRSHQMAWVTRWNPVRALIDLVRKPIVYGQLPDESTWIMAGVTAAVLALAASRLLGRLQKRLIFSL
jgi:lipopolysaccharide transport system permease protein